MNRELKPLRNLIILLVITILFTFTCMGQQVDSVAVMHPETRETLQMIYTPEKLGSKLDKLSDKHKTDIFVLLFFFQDGTVYGMRVRKDKELPIKEII